MEAILQYIAVHKDALDICIKAAGVVATIFGAGYVLYKHFSDKNADRMKTELDLRRQAYFDLFSALPMQLSALGKFAKSDDWIEIPPETYTALFRLHLLASNEALQCIIERNAIFHKGVIEMTTIKRTALQFASLGDSDPKVTEKVATLWEPFHTRKKQLLKDLSENYRCLLVHARKEIGLGGNMTPVLTALEADERLALGTMDQAG